MRASSRGALKPIPAVDSPLLSPPEHLQGAAPPTLLGCLFTTVVLDRRVPWTARDDIRRLPLILVSITAFSLSCARASANFWRAVVALRIESAWRVDWLGRPRLALARLAGRCGIVATPRGPGTVHVLSIPYKLLGDKRVPSTELRDRLSKCAGPF